MRRRNAIAAGHGCPFPAGAGAAGLAQLVEHVICNHGVTGSNPVAGTNKNNTNKNNDIATQKIQ
jgi:hypothetical protein